MIGYIVENQDTRQKKIEICRPDVNINWCMKRAFSLKESDRCSRVVVVGDGGLAKTAKAVGGWHDSLTVPRIRTTKRLSSANY